MPSTGTGHPRRDYASLLDLFDPKSHLLPAHLRDGRMQQAVDALWGLLGDRGVSWIGFYIKHPRRDEMILGPRRDKPACSPLGLHGMCGRCWLERKPILVADVATLGKNYIACDPRDKSEAVIPLLETDGTCWGVLDADSYDVGAFDTADIVGMTSLVEHAGLSHPRDPGPPILRL
jgi:L-methionine (R)-S-oxide reductase